jgi:penicillin-insensitive murein endopeptidase
MMRHALAVLFVAALLLPAPSFPQTAQSLFAARGTPSPHEPHSIGRHAQGCLAGGAQLPETGPTWQAMRLSRNRNWGHPASIAFVEDFSRQATRLGWRGLYIGDIGQPRGGPAGGHASHQIGLDIDIWLLPPARLNLSRAERERISSLNVRAENQRQVNSNWTPYHHALLEAAARDPRVERIFITPPVKLQMCADAPARDRAWLQKIRPWWGHNTHFHVRLKCPPGTVGCVDPDPLPAGDGCADAVWWVTDALAPPDPNAPAPQPRAPLRLADLPSQCTQVLQAR